MAIIYESDAKRTCANIAAIVDTIVMAKRRVKKRTDANIAITSNEPAKKKKDTNTKRVDANVVATTNKTVTACANVSTSNIRTDANVAVTTNAYTLASNIKEHVPIYWQPQMPM